MRSSRIHLVEPLGRGGIYQHTVAIAEALVERGYRVCLHTATDPEFEPDRRVQLCARVDWLRDRPTLRRLTFATRYLTRFLPQLLSSSSRGDIVHVQGAFREPLTIATVLATRAAGRRLVFTPHNTFSRTRSRLQQLLLPLEARLADTTVVFSEFDARRVKEWRGRPRLSALLQTAPLEPERVEAWRTRWESSERPCLLFAGQIRTDKRLDLLLQAVHRLSEPVSIAVVGDDLGDADRCRALAEQLGVHVDWSLGFHDLASFSAAIAAADLVVCPYDRGSQSGVLALAATVGTRTIATDVGGLGELADATVPRDDVGALVAALRRELSTSPPEPRCSHDGAVHAHVLAYAASRSPR